MIRNIIILVILICCSCTTPPLDLRRNLKYCYSGNYNSIDTVLNVDGYYKYVIYDKEYGDINSAFMLYRDGTVVDGFSGDSLLCISNSKKGSYYWGNYRIYKDTLRLELIVNFCKACAWSGHEVLYKIIDKNTLKKLQTKELRHSKEYRQQSVRYYNDNNCSIVKFNPLTHRKDSTFRFKKYEWFWCDKEKWRQYKKNLKSKR